MKSNQFNKNGEVDIDSLLAEIDNKVAKASAFSVQSRGGVDDASSLQARGGAKASSQSQTPRDVATSVDKGKNRQDDDTDSNSDDGEEVFLSHELEDAGDVAVEELNQNVQSLLEQINQFKSSFNTISGELSKAKMSKVALEEHIDELEEMNEILNTAVAQGGGLRNQNNNNNNINNNVLRINQSNSKSKTGDDVRRALIDNEDDEDGAELDLDKLLHNTSSFALIMSTILYFVPFKTVVRQMQARFGGSVAAYFIFYRFVFVQFSIMAVLCCGVAALHINHMLSRGDSFSLLIFEPAGVTNTGFLPRFMKYSSFDVSESMSYSCVVIIGLLVFSFSIIQKLLREDRLGKELAAMEKEEDFLFSKEVLCVWDYSLTAAVECDDLSGSISNSLVQQVDELKSKGLAKSRTYLQLATLYSLRFVGFILYAVLQTLAFVIIVLLTVNQATVAAYLTQLPFLKILSTFMVPIALNIIGSITPTLLQMITSFERWDSAQLETNILIFRMVLSNQLNVMILALSYLLLADPYLFAESNQLYLRNALEIAFLDTSFICRMDQVADSIFSLAVSSFLIKMFSDWAAGYSMYVLYVIILRKKDYKKTEFDIATFMVDLLNFAIIQLMLFPFAPLTMIFTPALIAITVLWQRKVLLGLYAKPLRPWKAEKAGTAFTLFYLFSLLLVAFPVAIFFFSVETFPKSCSIQDDSIGLCSDTLSSPVCSADYTANPTTVCTVDSGSTYYSSFSSSNYPNSVCCHACGPYVNEVSNMGPIHSYVQKSTISTTVWDLMFVYPYGPWIVVFILYLLSAFRNNSLSVANWSFDMKEVALETHILSLIAEKKKNEKTIQKLRSIDSGNAAVDVVDSDAKEKDDNDASSDAPT